MIIITGDQLTSEDVAAVANGELKVAGLSDTARENMEASYQWIADTVQNSEQAIYGVNTGVGPLATTRIRPEETRVFSHNIVLNCSVGVGSPLSAEVVRAMLLVRANALAKGRSGTRPVVVETLIEMLNKGVTPYIPSKGSLGASGDLAPLAHMAAVMTKNPERSGFEYHGRAWYEGRLMDGAEAMRRAGIPQLVLEAKEGLALTNGTTLMAAVAALTLVKAENLLRHAEIAAALSFEALMGLSDALIPLLHEANNQPGQVISARIIRRLLEGSRLIDTEPERVQDAYSLRCTPQVLGPTRDLLLFLRQRVHDAINAATDNPLIFMDLPQSRENKAVSGGNFHGEGLSMWLDFLGIALASVGNISERRTFRLLTPELNNGLPSMLVPNPGLDSGLMMPQYTAAALVSDNKTLAHPDSVDSIPSSANQEDYVSMGANAARHTLEISDNLRDILAIEMLTAAQGIDLRPNGPAELAPGTEAAFREIREVVEPLEHDRECSSDIEALATLIRSRKMVAAIEGVLGTKLE